MMKKLVQESYELRKAHVLLGNALDAAILELKALAQVSQEMKENHLDFVSKSEIQPPVEFKDKETPQREKSEISDRDLKRQEPSISHIDDELRELEFSYMELSR